jgi:hypothetical protein
MANAILTEFGVDPTPDPDAPTAEPPVDKPHADLVLMKSADPVSAFWLLLPRVGLDKKAGAAIAKECLNDFDKAFDKVYAQYVK